MFNEANVTSSACRLWRIDPVETSTPPKRNARTIRAAASKFKDSIVLVPVLVVVLETSRESRTSSKTIGK